MDTAVRTGMLRNEGKVKGASMGDRFRDLNFNVGVSEPAKPPPKFVVQLPKELDCA